MEIVIVDDGSQPPVEASTMPPEVTLLRQAQAKGSAAARNAGAAAATSRWIGFLDDDDCWLPGKAEEVLATAERFPEAKVISHRTAWQPSPRDGGFERLDDPVARVLRRQPPHISGVVVRKDTHELVGFDESMWASQDVDYLIRLAQVAEWVEIHKDLSRHQRVGTNESAVSIEARIAGRLSILDRHGQLIEADRIAHSFFYVRLGHQYRRIGRLADARACFTRALRLNPLSGLAWRGLILAGLTRNVLP